MRWFILRMTERDRKFIKFMCEYKLPMVSVDIARMFFNQNNNMSSAVVIANRRLSKMVQEQYIQKLPRKFSEQNIFYAGNKPNEKQLKHKLLFSRFISYISSSGFEIKDIKVEYNLPQKYGIRTDLFLTITYNNKTYYVLAEVDITKTYNENYLNVIHDIQNGLLKSEHEMIFVSISDFKIDNDELRKNVIQLDTEFKNFNKFVWRFIRW